MVVSVVRLEVGNQRSEISGRFSSFQQPVVSGQVSFWYALSKLWPFLAAFHSSEFPVIVVEAIQDLTCCSSSTGLSYCLGHQVI